MSAVSLVTCQAEIYCYPYVFGSVSNELPCGRCERSRRCSWSPILPAGSEARARERDRRWFASNRRAPCPRSLIKETVIHHGSRWGSQPFGYLTSADSGMKPAKHWPNQYSNGRLSKVPRLVRCLCELQLGWWLKHELLNHITCTVKGPRLQALLWANPWTC